MTSINQRRTTRVRCFAPARLEQSHGKVQGICGDLSLGGALFVGSLLPLCETVHLSLELQGLGTLQVPGEVIAHRNNGNRSASVIRFPRLSPHNLRLLSRLLARRTAG